MLDLVEEALRRHACRFERLDGSMSTTKLSKALATFRDDAKVEVMLMSLKAGCLGLNVTAANVVVLLDPWWHAGTELQAIGRAHRMGQTKPVRVLRFVAKDTIEVKMMQIQERKLKMSTQALGFAGHDVGGAGAGGTSAAARLGLGSSSAAAGGEGDSADERNVKLTLEDLKEFFV